MLGISMLIIGLFLGWFFFHSSDEKVGSTEVIEGHEGHDHASEDPTIWTCSMHPQIKQEEPGDCPICGMDLVPVSSLKSDGGEAHAEEIMMSEAAASLANIQTSRVSRGTPEKTIFLQGKVKADERRVKELTARFGGRIENLVVNFTGQYVEKGEKLGTLYSPELVTAQRELLEAISLRESRPRIYRAARAKLKLWDLTDEQIRAIEEKGEPEVYFDVLSPISGTVMKRHVAQGDYVKTGDPLFRVTDLSKVWVLFDAYESDIPWIREGDRLEFSIQSITGQTFETRVTWVDPFIDSKTRTASVRAELQNPDGDLKPEMYARGTLYSSIAEGSDRILIPGSSILWTGKRSVVYVKVPDRESPSFLHREISLGPKAGDYYVVTDGLEEGEEIATNGVFKIDAAAQLEGKRSMMNPSGKEAAPTVHDHGSMDMDGTGEIAKEDVPEEDISAPEEFRQQLTDVYYAYLKMKDAFVASDPVEVSKEAEKVAEELKDVDMSLLEGAVHMAWMDQLETLNSTIKVIRNYSDIEEQRKEFSDFNLAFYKSVKNFRLSGVKTYYQYCPMANRDMGAYWFSETEEILNPYFGDMMLKCGENRESFNELE